jgi:hypothetical protein
MVDALSFSVTIQMAMKELGLPAPGHAHGTFNVIIAGATEWAEQRVAIVSASVLRGMFAERCVEGDARGWGSSRS